MRRRTESEGDEMRGKMRREEGRGGGEGYKQ
jgi:hypothetical protein